MRIIMKAVNNIDTPKKDFTDVFLYILIALLGISFVGMVVFLVYSFFS